MNDEWTLVRLTRLTPVFFFCCRGYRAKVDDTLTMLSISGSQGPTHRRLLEVPGATVAHQVLRRLPQSAELGLSQNRVPPSPAAYHMPYASLWNGNLQKNPFQWESWWTRCIAFGAFRYRGKQYVCLLPDARKISPRLFVQLKKGRLR